MYSKLKTFLFLAGCIFLYVPQTHASPEDTQQPITIEADRAVLDEKKQISTYTGNVILKQGGIEVKANIVTVYAKEGQLQRVVAEGNPVHYIQHQQSNENIRGVSQRMEYEIETKRLLLLDNAKLWQGKNHFSGERIQYDPKNEKVIATGGTDDGEEGAQRVQITIQPQSESQTQKQKNLKQPQVNP